MYTKRYTEVATEISQVSRKRGRGAVPPVRIEKAAFSPIDRSSRRWQLHREIGSHVGNGVGKLLSGMSAGLLTNRRKETTWEENIRESIGRRKEYWPRYEIAGFFYCVKIENIGFCSSTISWRFFGNDRRANDSNDLYRRPFAWFFWQRSTKICLTYFSLFSWFKFKIALTENREDF